MKDDETVEVLRFVIEKRIHQVKDALSYLRGFASNVSAAEITRHDVAGRWDDKITSPRDWARAALMISSSWRAASSEWADACAFEVAARASSI